MKNDELSVWSKAINIIVKSISSKIDGIFLILIILINVIKRNWGINATTCIHRKLKIEVRSVPVKNAFEIDAADRISLKTREQSTAKT